MSSVDRALASILSAFQHSQDASNADAIVSSIRPLLTNLSNRLNITLLCSQLLIAPAIWNQADVRVSFRIIGVFNAAAIAIRQREIDDPHASGEQLSCNDWATAVIKGADNKSPRWRHSLIIAGVLKGMEGQGRRGLSGSLRSSFEAALAMATNLALEEPNTEQNTESLVLALTHTFELLSENVRRSLNLDALAPIIIRCIFGRGGFQGGSFLSHMNNDLTGGGTNKIEWSSKSASFRELQSFNSNPTLSSLGLLSELAAYVVENLRNSRQFSTMLDDILAFSISLAHYWRSNIFSGVDHSRDTEVLTPDTLRITSPVLWQVLKTAMFATINILRSIIGRTLIDPVLADDRTAPLMAVNTLHILRNIYFIAARFGPNSFTAYTFAFYTSVDILARFPDETQRFLSQIRPVHVGGSSVSPLDRNLDLFYLNLCEHFTLVLSPGDNESLIVAAAMPYIQPSADQVQLEIFEAAHSAVLAVLGAPQNADLTMRLVPLYVQILFASFPTHLSSRQFRFAFKSLIQITSPPAPLSASNPQLPDTLLELLHHRITTASALPLPKLFGLGEKPLANEPSYSEQAILLITLLDALPFLPLHLLEEWLPLSAELLNTIRESSMREVCKARFWEILESGEMDVDRAAISVEWWSTRGGREAVLFGTQNGHGGPFMSGGLGDPTEGSRL